jgi:hypothetical protein
MRLAPGSASRREVLVVLVVLVVLSRRFLLYICRWAIYLVFPDRDESWLLEELLRVFRVPSRVWGRCLKFRDLVVCGAVSATALGLA